MTYEVAPFTDTDIIVCHIYGTYRTRPATRAGEAYIRKLGLTYAALRGCPRKGWAFSTRSSTSNSLLRDNSKEIVISKINERCGSLNCHDIL
jgi:hypothetical protein